MITLKNICQYVQFLHSYSRKRDRPERMEQCMETYHPLQLDSLLQAYCFHVLKKKFKPLSQSQSLKFLAHLLNTESRKNIFYYHSLSD